MLTYSKETFPCVTELGGLVEKNNITWDRKFYALLEIFTVQIKKRFENCHSVVVNLSVLDP